MVVGGGRPPSPSSPAAGAPPPALNVIIPMGALSGDAPAAESAYARAGYALGLPPPLVPVAGRPVLFWLLDNITLREEDHLWLVVSARAEQRYGIGARVHEEYPWLGGSGRLHVVPLRFTTRGAAETLYIATQAMGAQDLQRRTISLDSDTIYFTDVLERFRRVPRGVGCCFCFYHPEADRRHSYLAFDLTKASGARGSDRRGTDARETAVPPPAEHAAGVSPMAEPPCPPPRQQQQPVVPPLRGPAVSSRSVGSASSSESPHAVMSPRLLGDGILTQPTPRHGGAPLSPEATAWFNPRGRGGDARDVYNAAPAHSTTTTAMCAGSSAAHDARAHGDAASAAVAAARRIERIVEKHPISAWANCGAYGFASGCAMQIHCQHIINSSPGDAPNDVSPNEIQSKGTCADAYYISAAVESAIRAGKPFVGINLGEVDRAFANVGSVSRLERFIAAVAERGPEVYPCKSMRFSFDLDGGLLGAPVHRGDLDSAVAIPAAVNAVRRLKAHGHTVIIRSTRGTRSTISTGDALASAAGADSLAASGAVSGGGALSTLRALDKHAIPYDEVLFGQPRVDAHVGPAAIDPSCTFGGMARAFGIVPCMDSNSEDYGAVVCDPAGAQGAGGGSDGVKARHFNIVRMVGDTVVKTSSTRRLEGEVYYFRHVPKGVDDLFPALLSVEEDPGADCTTMTIQRVEGITFTHLVTNRCVTRERFGRLTDALARLHGSKGQATAGVRELPEAAAAAATPEGPAIECGAASPELNPYANYALKVETRYKQHAAMYKSLPTSGGINVDEAYDEIMTFLQGYEADSRADVRECIHGDPVFSNGLLTADHKVQFIDMHGCLGGALTTAGDAAYDLAKVLQSLCGYDYVLLDAPMEARDVELLDLLKADFAAHVGAKYPRVRFRDVEMLTASLYFSLLPLHDNPTHRARFWSICQAMLHARNALRNVLVGQSLALAPPPTTRATKAVPPVDTRAPRARRMAG